MFNLPASMGITDILSLAIAAVLVNNYILVQFLGCCSFFGVSKKTDTAVGMGMAVIFVMALASAVSWVVWYFILEPLNLQYMLAIVLFATIRERLDATAKCPKCFEGFPICLISAALLAMSFMGFSGLSIPW